MLLKLPKIKIVLNARLNQSRFVCLIALLVFLKSSAQHLNDLSQPIFEKINSANGLSNNRINSIVKGPNGFMWIGTNNGLNRYDGYAVRVYNQQNSNLASNDITDILIDAADRMWIATNGGGLSLYDLEKDNFDVFKNDPNDQSTVSSNIINVLYEDSKGNIWIGTENGFCLFHRESRKFISWLNSFSSGVTCFLETEKGLLIGTFGDGLKIYDHVKQQLSSVMPNNKKLGFIHTLSKLDDDITLIGTRGFGLLALNSNAGLISSFFKDKKYQDELGKIVRSIKKDSIGTIWIGTDGNGLFKLVNNEDKDRRVTNYIHNSQVSSSLSANAIYEIFIDDESNIWIGTAWDGINFLNNTTSASIILSDIKGTNTSPVLSINSSDNLFIMGLDGGGLTIVDTLLETYRTFNENDLGAGYVQHIMKASDGTFWLGTFTNGLIHIDTNGRVLKRFKSDGTNNGLRYNDIRFILEDEKNNFWVASWEGGLSYLDIKTETFTHYTSINDNLNSLSSNNVVSLEQDGKNLWIATFGGGVTVMNTETKVFKHFKYDETNENSLSSDNIAKS